MAKTAGVYCFEDHFCRAQAFTTTPGVNGWTIKDTSAAGTPTYLCITDDCGAAKLTMASTSEAEILTLYQNDVLPLDLAQLQRFWFVAKVAGIDAVTTLVMGLADAQNDTVDSVATNCWFKIDGAVSTSAVVIETDDGVTDDDDNSTGGITLSSTYKMFEINFGNGLSDIRFYADGIPVGSQTFSLAGITAGQNVQPFFQLQKASGTGVGSVTLAAVGWETRFSYGS